MAESNSQNLIPSDYEIIFQQLESSEAHEVDLIYSENDEINELRKIVAEMSEPDIVYGTSSFGESDLVDSIHITYSNC